MAPEPLQAETMLLSRLDRVFILFFFPNGAARLTLQGALSLETFLSLADGV